MTSINNIPRRTLTLLAQMFFNRNRSLIFCTLFILLSLWIETGLGIDNFFSCSGSLATLAGLFLNIKYSLNFHLDLPKTCLYNKLAGGGIFGTTQITREQEQWVDEIIADEMYGVIFMIAGTLIWAYGNYLVTFLH